MERYHLYTWLTGHLFIVDRSPEDLTQRKITYYSTNIHGQVVFKSAEEYPIKSKVGHILRRMRKPGCNSNPRVSDYYVYHYLLTVEEKEGLLFRADKDFSRDYLMASNDLSEIHEKMVVWAWENQCSYADFKGANLEYAIGTYIAAEKVVDLTNQTSVDVIKEDATETTSELETVKEDISGGEEIGQMCFSF